MRIARGRALKPPQFPNLVHSYGYGRNENSPRKGIETLLPCHFNVVIEVEMRIARGRALKPNSSYLFLSFLAVEMRIARGRALKRL